MVEVQGMELLKRLGIKASAVAMALGL